MRRASIKAANGAVIVGGAVVTAGIVAGPQWSTVLWGFTIAGVFAAVGSVLRREGVEIPGG